MVQPKKKLDMVVKLGVGVMVTSFMLIFIGMFLTRPDRSIPPFSIGAQEGTTVALHVPSWTSDAEIETLLYRFRTVAKESGGFGLMKIQPTTPDDPEGRYAKIRIFVFTDDSWTEPERLHHYLEGHDPTVRKLFERAMRGSYQLEGHREVGRIGRLLSGPDSPATAAYSRVIFEGTGGISTDPHEGLKTARGSSESGPGPLSSTTDPEGRGL